MAQCRYHCPPVAEFMCFWGDCQIQQRLIVPGQSQSGGKQPGEHPPTSVPGNTQTEDASAPAMSSLQKAKTGYIRTKTGDKRLIKSELTLARENTGAGFIQETSPAFPLPSMASWYGKGDLWELLSRSGAAAGAPRQPRVRGLGRERPRYGAGGGCAERAERAQGQRRCQEKRRGEAGAGRYARYAIYRFISPGYREGKQRTAIEGL